MSEQNEDAIVEADVVGGVGNEIADIEELPEEDVVDDPADDHDEVIITIGNEKPKEEEQHAPEWVREVRKANRELQRENRELKAKLTAPAEKAATLSAKPKLDDFDYDSDKYEAALGDWFDAKRKADDHEKKQRDEQDAQQRAWQERLDNYGKSKGALKVSDYDDAEGVVQESLSTTQQGIVLQGAENPALVIYALGKNQKTAKDLAAITDPVKFAFAVAKLESQLKVTPKKSPPPPEKTVTGTARISGTTDSTLDRLRAEAEKTGDMSKVIAYKQQKRA
jgi:FtsZ-binding cell division protein ZapB